MDKRFAITSCDDGMYFCFPPRITVALMSILSMVVCVVDYKSTVPCDRDTVLKVCMDGMRLVLATLFQLANVMLLTASVFENAYLVNMYLMCVLGYVVMGLGMALIELLVKFKHEGWRGLVGFGVEVAFLFVIARCLLLVDTYRKQLINKL